jgi:recombination protein RecA
MPAPCNKVVWIDLEGTFDPSWAALFGIDVDELIVVKPSYGEEAVDMVDALIQADDVALLVLDSLAVVVASKEIEQSAEKFDVGTAAILVKRMCNKLVIALSKEAKRDHTPAVILINQTRFKVGVMFGDPETMPGGQTMKFLSSLTVRLYGKNKMLKEVSADMPAFKETNAVIKKAKVPVTKMVFDYEMVVFPHDGLRVGETRSWNKVSSELKQLGHLEKTPKGWKLLGHEYQTLAVIQDTYEAEDAFAAKLQKMVIDSSKGKVFLVEAEGAAKG